MKFSIVAVALFFGIAYAAPFLRLEGRAIEVETISHVENKTPVTDGDPYGPFKSRRAVEEEEEEENEVRSLDDSLEERDPKDNRNGAARAPIFTGDPVFHG
ncbi:hypothetical protein CGCA056_v000106 [Colletotrichum aenigma]|uniref:uncharacterized protein n=1 Tax=Colletotrichum aenigma TaxID=1215731 RepID=UPI001872F0D7|nr:uncharacterized protein CGCA056_v000106 [Colletotrichum aenigma]KAF5528709.1 hypothetical protein CGCA056_v000106 [Colletotrichum aenigma]